MCSAHTEKFVTGAQINMTTSLFNQARAYLIISYLKVAHGLCDLTYTTSEVVLDLKDKRKGFQSFE